MWDRGQISETRFRRPNERTMTDGQLFQVERFQLLDISSATESINSDDWWGTTKSHCVIVGIFIYIAGT